MKTSCIKHVSATALAAALLAFPFAGAATTVIGSWQTSTAEGWIDWGNGLAITDAANSAKYSFVAGAVSGYAQSLKITHNGWNQNLAIKLQDNGLVNAFMNNQLLTFTFSVPPSAASSGFARVHELAINAQGYGWNSQPFNANWSATGYTSDNQGTQPNFWFWDGAPARSQTVTLNYSSILGSFPANPGWVELIFSFNNGGNANNSVFMNQVTLSQIPEPGSLALVGLGAVALLVARRRRSA